MDPQDILEAVEDSALRMVDMDEMLKRLFRHRHHDDILAEFTSDAVRLLIFTMFTSQSEKIKLEAVKEVLNRSIGKPLERSVTMSLNPNELSDNEVDVKIQELMSELGYTRSKKGTTALLVEGEGEEGQESSSELQPFTVAGSVSKEQG